jgi:MoaA/NifB/PqqE/SkfB family radical SAM enzyme
MIKSINWIITDKCNGRCVHCDIGSKKDRSKDLSIDGIDRVLSDRVVQKGYAKYGKEYDISFAGGEPFLRDDLQAIIDLVEKKCPGSFKCITTNGLLEQKISGFIKTNRHLKFKLNVSVDGLEDVHDLLRGPGAFKRTIRTIYNIKERYPQQNVEIKLTLSPHNFDQVLNVYTLASKLGCQFSFKPAENLKYYTNSRDPLDLTFTADQLCIIRDQAFKLADVMFKKKEYRKAKFFQDIPFYLAKKKMPRTCSVLKECLTIMPNGACFSCIKEPEVGRIPEVPLAKINSGRDIKRFQCQSCMLMCGAYKDYENMPFERVVKDVRIQNVKEMDLDVFRSLIKKDAGISHVSFIGADPFLNRSFFDIMNYLDTLGITYGITTDGALITDDVIMRLKACIGLKSILFSDGVGTSRGRSMSLRKKCSALINISAR